MYYAVYDIVDNSTRDSVIHILKDAGFVRIQKSVFCGSASNQQKKDLIESVKNVLDVSADSFYLLASCNVCFGSIEIIGKDFDKQYVAGEKSSVVL